METIAKIRVGRLLSGYKAVGEGVNNAVKGIAQTSTGEVTVIAKQLNDRELAVEIICAAIGREIGLPIPEPIFLIHPDNSYYYGSVFSNHPELANIITPYDQSILQELLKWGDITKASCFDELIANGDRHDSNILFDGKGFILIDHGLSIPYGLQSTDFSNDYYENRLLDDIIEESRSNDLLKQKRINEVRNWIDNQPNSFINIGIEQCNDYLDSTYKSQFLDFLTKRFESLGDALYNKIKPTKQMKLNMHD